MHRDAKACVHRKTGFFVGRCGCEVQTERQASSGRGADRRTGSFEGGAWRHLALGRLWRGEMQIEGQTSSGGTGERCGVGFGEGWMRLRWGECGGGRNPRSGADRRTGLFGRGAGGASWGWGGDRRTGLFVGAGLGEGWRREGGRNAEVGEICVAGADRRTGLFGRGGRWGGGGGGIAEVGKICEMGVTNGGGSVR
jgi:hypothetical protein